HLDAQEQQVIVELMQGITAVAWIAFIWIPAVPVLVEFIIGLIASSILSPGYRYGLCGGMAASSADYPYLDQLLPRTTALPEHGSAPQAGALRDCILQRMVDSLVEDGARFLEWIFVLKVLPGFLGGGPGALRDRTRDEVVRLQGLIDQGKPW